MQRAHAEGLMKRPFSIGFASVVLSVAACSSTSSPEGHETSAQSDAGEQNDGVAPNDAGGGAVGVGDQECTALASAICDRFEACAPFLLQDVYGDSATCKVRAKLDCTLKFGAPGSSARAAQTAGCAEAVPAIECQDLLARRMPDACKPDAGTLADGSGCVYGMQCASRACLKPSPDAACGTCGAPARSGASCTVDDDCADGLTCTQGTCVAAGGLGAKCDSTAPCATGACSAGTCVAAKAVGAPCTPAFADCDIAHGIACNGASTCAPVARAELGQTCGVTNGTFTDCAGGATCPQFPGLPGPSKCTARPADGAACLPAGAGAAGCLAPARCALSSFSLVCTVPDPHACK
jgi:hypothetical protein